MNIRRIIAGSTAALTATTLVACSGDNAAYTPYSKDDTITIGTTDAGQYSKKSLKNTASTLRLKTSRNTPSPTLL